MLAAMNGNAAGTVHSSRARRPSSLLALGVLASCVLAAGCRDKGKQSAEAASADLHGIVALAEKDVGEIERGLPEGGVKMTKLLGGEANPPSNPAAVRSALLKIRQQVPDLGVAKSTFFAFTDEKGIAVRNDLEQDTMAGKDVLVPYPAFRKVLEGAPFVTTQGQFPGPANPQGPDKEWVAAVPVKSQDGTATVGMLVTGWTYRRFAYHLQEALKRDLQEQLMQSGDKGKLPVVYAFLFDQEGVYGARGTPPVNEKALGDLKLAEKTASGPASAPIVIEERPFGWAAARVPKLGDNVGVVMLRSEI